MILNYDTLQKQKTKELLKTNFGTYVQEDGQAVLNEPVVRLSDLQIGFASQEIIKNFNIGFPQNQITALLGPTGSGKSTLLRTLNRLNELVPGFWMKGSVALDGRDIYRDF